MITEEEALKNCNNPNELALKLKGISATSDRMWQPVDDAHGEPDLARSATAAPRSGAGSQSGRAGFAARE